MSNSKTDKSTSLPSMSSLQQHQGNLSNNNFSSTAHVVTNEEDLAVLSIVDAFCAKPRQISGNECKVLFYSLSTM